MKCISKRAPHPPSRCGMVPPLPVGEGKSKTSPLPPGEGFGVRLLLLTLTLFLSACNDNGFIHGMEDQPKLTPMEPSSFFADGRSARQPVEGTVARGQLRED